METALVTACQVRTSIALAGANQKCELIVRTIGANVLPVRIFDRVLMLRTSLRINAGQPRR